MFAVDGSWRRQRRRVHEQLAIPGTVLTAEIEASNGNRILEISLHFGEDGDHDAHRLDIH